MLTAEISIYRHANYLSGQAARRSQQADAGLPDTQPPLLLVHGNEGGSVVQRRSPLKTLHSLGQRILAQAQPLEGLAQLHRQVYVQPVEARAPDDKCDTNLTEPSRTKPNQTNFKEIKPYLTKQTKFYSKQIKPNQIESPDGLYPVLQDPPVLRLETA